MTDQPTFYFAPGAGYMSSRSSWDKDAVQVQAVCGKTWSTHQDAAGTFTLCRGGDWLVGHAKQWSASGIQHGAEFTNCLTIDGRGQDNMQDRTARVTFVDDNAKRMIWQMEAGQAYDYSVTSSNRIKPLKSWRRTLVFLKPGVLIVHDRVEKNDPKSVVMLPINTHRVFNAQLGLTEGGSDLYMTAVKPNGTPAMRGMLLGSGGALSSYQTIFQNPLGQAVDEFLMVYQVGASGFVPLPVTRTGSAARVGDDEAIFHEDGTVEMVDHRVIPSVEAMWSLWRAVEKWADTEADSDIPAAVAAAKHLLEVANV